MLRWCVAKGASDTTIQSDKPVYIEVDGVLFPVTRRNLDSADLANILITFTGRTLWRNWLRAAISICPMKFVPTATRAESFPCQHHRDHEPRP